MPWLTLYSALAAGYGAWAFDLVILLVPIVALAQAIGRTGQLILLVGAGTAYLGLNLAVLLTIREAGSQANPWIAPVVFASYTLGWLTLRPPPGEAALEPEPVEMEKRP